MNVETFMDALVFDKVQVILFFVLLPAIVLGLNRIAQSHANDSPYKYAYSTLIYLSASVGSLSAAFWVYSMAFQHKKLSELDFFIYYLPMLGMMLNFWLVGMKANIKTLPWFGELSELLLLVSVSFGMLLVILHFQWLPFQFIWQVFLSAGLIFLLFKFSLDYFQRQRSRGY